jgi:hypothetical protein
VVIGRRLILLAVHKRLDRLLLSVGPAELKQYMVELEALGHGFEIDGRFGLRACIALKPDRLTIVNFEK